MKKCIFCQIVKNLDEKNRLIETELSLAFNDIHPKAPVHILIIPKRHLEEPHSLSSEELADLFRLAEKLAKQSGVGDSGYRLLFNVGKHAGQEIDHAHLHLIGGAPSKGIY